MKAKKKYQFSGHETFPLRQLWLLKAVKYVQATKNNQNSDSSSLFHNDEAMIMLGVGKNMLLSMKFWAVQCGFLDADNYAPTNLAELIFGSESIKALDKWEESPTTAWIVHWNLASVPNKLTALWFLFNKINQQTISREELLGKFTEFVHESGLKISTNTLKRDLEVCIRSYTPRTAVKEITEEGLDSLLVDLGILRNIGRDSIDLSRNIKPSLPDALFFWAVLDSWDRIKASSGSSLSWAKLAYEPGFPGKVFKLSEDDLYRRLQLTAELTEGKLQWVDQLGIKNIIFNFKSEQERQLLKAQLLQRAFL